MANLIAGHLVPQGEGKRNGEGEGEGPGRPGRVEALRPREPDREASHRRCRLCWGRGARGAESRPTSKVGVDSGTSSTASLAAPCITSVASHMGGLGEVSSRGSTSCGNEAAVDLLPPPRPGLGPAPRPRVAEKVHVKAVAREVLHPEPPPRRRPYTRRAVPRGGVEGPHEKTSVALHYTCSAQRRPLRSTGKTSELD